MPCRLTVLKPALALPQLRIMHPVVSWAMTMTIAGSTVVIICKENVLDHDNDIVVLHSSDHFKRKPSSTRSWRTPTLRICYNSDLRLCVTANDGVEGCVGTLPQFSTFPAYRIPYMSFFTTKYFTVEHTIAMSTLSLWTAFPAKTFPLLPSAKYRLYPASLRLQGKRKKMTAFSRRKQRSASQWTSRRYRRYAFCKVRSPASVDND